MRPINTDDSLALCLCVLVGTGQVGLGRKEEEGGGCGGLWLGVLARTTVAVAFISTGGFYRGPVCVCGLFWQAK